MYTFYPHEINNNTLMKENKEKINEGIFHVYGHEFCPNIPTDTTQCKTKPQQVIL